MKEPSDKPDTHEVAPVSQDSLKIQVQGGYQLYEVLS